MKSSIPFLKKHFKKLVANITTISLMLLGVLVPIQESQARLIFTTEDDGVNADVYHLDKDDTATDFIDLEFGSTVGARLRYNKALDKFILNRPLDLDGNELLNFRIENRSGAVISGGITGTTDVATDPRLVSTSADVTGTLSIGDYIKLATGVNGNIVRYQVQSIATGPTGFTVDQDMVSDITAGTILIDDAPICNIAAEGRMIYDTDMNKMLFCDGADWVDPADAIQPGAITSTEIADETITFDDIAPRLATETLTPEFQNFTIFADGSNNVGTLESDYDNTNQRNFYRWSTQKSDVAQDYDLIVQWPVPENFQRFCQPTTDTDDLDCDAEIQLDFRTNDTVISNNKLDITLLDTTGSAIALTGTTDLVSTTAATWVDNQSVVFATEGDGTFTPGEYLTLQVKLTSINSADITNPADLGAIKFNYIAK